MLQINGRQDGVFVFYYTNAPYTAKETPRSLAIWGLGGPNIRARGVLYRREPCKRNMGTPQPHFASDIGTPSAFWGLSNLVPPEQIFLKYLDPL